MAEISSPTDSVHQLLENATDDVPQRYIWIDNSDKHGLTNQLTVPLATEIPIIDVSKLLSNSQSTMDAELLKLRDALSSWGCFQAINHGIEHSLIDEMRQVVKEFLNLPMEEKLKYGRPTEDDRNFQGYGHDIVWSDENPLDWGQRLLLFVIPEDVRKLQYWPQNPPSFRNVLHEYSTRVKRIHEQLLNAIATTLSLPEDSFLKQFGERGTVLARFNYYPPCPKPDQVTGLKPHADVCGLTILLQDEEVLGLHILKDNQWYAVPIVPHALLVNAGEQLEIMSNGILKAPVHKAVVNPMKARSSLAMFYSPDPAVEVQPLDELVDEKRPRVFNKVKNYPETYNYLNYYQKGKSGLDSIRI